MPNSIQIKRMRAAGILLCGALLAIVPAMAQQDAPPPPPQGNAQGAPPGGGQGGRGGMSPERRLEMMQTQLNLTPDQVTSIKAIFADGQAKMEAVRSDTTLSQDDRRAKMMSMRTDENAKVKAVLTPDQQTKFDDMQSRMRQRQQGGGPPPPPQ
jgi:protein CpxP